MGQERDKKVSQEDDEMVVWLKALWLKAISVRTSIEAHVVYVSGRFVLCFACGLL